MDTLREDHSSLNHFTTEQLVALSYDMALFRSGQPLSQRTCMMLQLICQLDSKEIARELRRHIGTAMDVDEADSATDEELSTAAVPANDPFVDLRDSDLFKALREHFDDNTSLAAIITFYDEVQANAQGLQDRLLDWAMEHEDTNFDNVLDQFSRSRANGDDKTEPMDVNSGPQIVETNQMQTFSDVFEFSEDQSMSLSKKMDLVWQKFLNFINKLDIADYVNFKVIARILEELSKLESNVKPFRKMVPTLNVGKPNLILCPEKEMLPICLSLYAFDETKNVPRNDEVLICSSHTSIEQIELFCRKSFHDQTGRIFCIVHAEYMDFRSCVHVEKILQESTVSNHEYKLVFLASKELNEQTYISTSLEKFLMPAPFLNYDLLRKYLLQNLVQSKQSADPSQCSGRVVVSKEAGNGKSLVVKRLASEFDKNIVVTQIDKKNIDYDHVIDRLFDKRAGLLQSKKGAAYHFDFSCQFTRHKEDLIFQLIVLRGISKPQTGELFLFSGMDYCLAEISTIGGRFLNNKKKGVSGRKPLPLLDILPKIECLSPRESLTILEKDPKAFGLVPKREGDYFKSFDERMYNDSQFQRPYKVKLFSRAESKNLSKK